VVDDRDFEQPVRRDLGAEQLLSEEGEVGNVIDDGLGDASSRVADDGSFGEFEAENDRGIDPVIEAGDDEHLGGGRTERNGGVVTGERLVTLQQGGSSWS